MMSFRNKVASLVVVALGLTIGLIASRGGTAHAQPVCVDVPIDTTTVPFCISLEPETATNAVGTTHTVTATVTADAEPVEEILVAINIELGPNTDEFDVGFTDASGQFALTYIGDGGPGTDRIAACFENEEFLCVGTDFATKDWVGPTPTPTPSPTPSPTPTPTPTPTPSPTAVLGVTQLPTTGGSPGAGGLPWLAIAIGALALTSGGLALAYRTRRIR